MKFFLITVFTSLNYCLSMAQNAPDIVWKKCLGGSKNDYASSIEQTSDGGYIVAGTTTSNDSDVVGFHPHPVFTYNEDGWLVKLNDSGAIQWQKCLGGQNDDGIVSASQTSDGGYIVGGWAGSYDGNVVGLHGAADFWIVKLNDTGAIQWQKCLGGSLIDVANCLSKTKDGGYIMAGVTTSVNGDVTAKHDSSDEWILKLNDTGGIQWQKCLGGSRNEEARSIEQTSDSGYIVAGFTTSNDGDVSGFHGGDYEDYWIVKLSKTGNIQWQKCLGGSRIEQAYSIHQTSGGGYIVAGATTSNDGDASGLHGVSGQTDGWILQLNDTGGIVWQKCYGGEYEEYIGSIVQTNEGGYIAAGAVVSADGDGDVEGNQFGWDDFWVLKLDTLGHIAWQKCIGSGTSQAYSIRQTSEGGYIVAGYATGNLGDVSGNKGAADFWVVKLSQWPTDVEKVAGRSGAIVVSPNPSDGHFYIRLPEDMLKAGLSVTNTFGQEILCKEVRSANTEITMPHVPGIYFVKLSAGSAVYTSKLIVE